MTLGRWVGPGIVAVTGAALAAWTWRAWPDPVVDFGRELYVPWRLAQGDTLFRDIAWFNGPLSPYWNALWFRAFGTGLMTIVLVNLALLAATTHVIGKRGARGRLQTADGSQLRPCPDVTCRSWTQTGERK